MRLARPCLRARMFGALLLIVAGCTSTPQASRERDVEARQFDTHPNAATLYVYRPQASAEDSVLWIGNRLIGSTLPFTYFRINLEPGKHRLTGMAADNGKLVLETRPGVLYFVALKVHAGQSYFQRVPEAAGREAIANCCNLLENWVPGQRPLLR